MVDDGGDHLWTDRGSRTELELGSVVSGQFSIAVVHSSLVDGIVGIQ